MHGDVMNETHIHDPPACAAKSVRASRNGDAPSEDRTHSKDRVWKRPLVDNAQADDAPLMTDTSEVSSVSATPVMPEDTESAKNAGTESSPTPENLDAGADESIEIPETAATGDTDLVSGETPADGEDLQATAEGEENTPLPSFEPTPVAQAVIPTDAEIQDRIDEAYARGLSEGDSQARQRLEDGQRLENLATG